MSDAKFMLEHGNLYPYDSFMEFERAIPGDWAVRAARGVVADLTDRRDVKRGFANVDEDVRIEIIQSLAEIIRLAEAEANR